jgi:hypothetical protein
MRRVLLAAAAIAAMMAAGARAGDVDAQCGSMIAEIALDARADIGDAQKHDWGTEVQLSIPITGAETKVSCYEKQSPCLPQGGERTLVKNQQAAGSHSWPKRAAS